MVSSDKCDQQVQPEAPRKQQKERCVLPGTKAVPPRTFWSGHGPQSGGACGAGTNDMAEYEIKIWFKHQHAKDKQKTLWKSHEVLPE